MIAEPTLLVADARELRGMKIPAPDCIVTSPPYLDMYDYGSAGQIGFGQGEADYFGSMRGVLGALFDVSKSDATLWLVAGSLRRKGRLLDLPGRLLALAEEAGWVLREDVTWNKTKSMPWTKHGELRDVTERLLFFSKSDSFQFNADAIRSPEPNSLWWQRYPERYSPGGWRPTNVWDVAIPTQGSWGVSRGHVCPFPPELVHRILTLSTSPGDVVLDPFAGVGSVPVMASLMRREGWGIDLSADFLAQSETTHLAATDYLSSLDSAEARKDLFRETIRRLRILKFARLLGKALVSGEVPVFWVVARLTNRKPARAYSEFAADYVIGTSAPEEAVRAAAEAISARSPLSKFGIDARFVTEDGPPPVGLHWWSDGRFWLQPKSTRSTTTIDVGARFTVSAKDVDDTPYA